MIALFLLSFGILAGSIAAAVIGSLRAFAAAKQHAERLQIEAERQRFIAAFCAEYGQHDRSPKGAV